MQLVTELIVLATALVGLYKAATYHRPASSGDESSSTPSADPSGIGGVVASILGKFDDLFDLAGLFVFMLAFPAFVYAFMWVMSSIPDLLSDSISSDIDMPAIEIGPDATKTELMLIAAVEIGNDHSRNTRLGEIVDEALKKKQYRTAIKAASAITRQYTRDNEMSKIIEALAGSDASALKPGRANKKMQPTAESGG